MESLSSPPTAVQPLPSLRRTVPQPRFKTRLHFIWAVIWAAWWTMIFAPIVIVHATFRPGARTLQRWIRPWARLLLWGIGVRLHTAMRAPLDPAQPVVFVANHQNALDILTTAAGIPTPFGFTAKAALRRTPFIGAVLAHTACVFVDRSTPRRAVRSMVEAGAQIRAGNAVLVFAEGHRTWKTELAPFLRGAFMLAVEAGVPVVPVVLDGDVGVLDERVWSSRPGDVRLVIGEPIPTDGCARRDIPALMNTARKWMEWELGREE
ncbi:MAG: 1-acyl-sn-glycerol-3-phosphate acyltransferase [Rhodothermaceae bacterium]|nr:1-acyl-sn-glycerol-3-phosphate acyltransferase [Rhodothermaceae bacterium]